MGLFIVTKCCGVVWLNFEHIGLAEFCSAIHHLFLIFGQNSDLKPGSPMFVNFLHV